MRILTGNSDSLWLRDNVGLLAVGEGRSIWAVGDILWDDSSSPVLILRGNCLGDWCWWIRWFVHNWGFVFITTLWRGSWAVDSVDWLSDRAWAVIMGVRYVRLKFKTGDELCLPVIVKVVASVTV